MYCIVRNYFSRPSEIMEIDLTLEEAQAHCNSPDTKGDGWFDGYTDQDNRPQDVEAFRNGDDHDPLAEMEALASAGRLQFIHIR